MSQVLPIIRLNEEEEMFREAVLDFAREQIAPHVMEMDQKAQFRRELLDQFFELGLMGIDIPEAYGGTGGNFFMSILAIEALASVDASAAIYVDVQNTLVNNAFMRWGNEAIKQKYLPQLAQEKIGAYALSEPSSGSDAFGLKARGEDKGDHFVLNGTKLWITNAAEADIFLVFANINPELGYKGITAFVIERGFDGFKVGKKEDKLGIRASSTCELIMENCIVPKENVLGETGKGYKVAIETLNEGRIGIGAQMLGIMQGSLDAGVQYAQERSQFGRQIAQFQGLRFQIAEAKILLEASRRFVYNAARMKDAGDDFVMEAAMAKYFSSVNAEKVTSRMIDIFGGYGYTKDYPVEKFYRDSKIGQIYEGTSNMQLDTIGKFLLK
ncbi:MAG: acyl-CoA dehydrogenase [Calditrichaeota bacterium]|nr:acyl-CoA dehydrogenase [Calditrichota bacterium]MCB0306740.1 acyl-CoA dehydrogenase [Calditrichota bacterium]MCB0314704.1 acyl-CoA dehydrogenase [Calditrichota bacterium]MCB9089706.1 acyl-CoA dehydrogenase [Calditrichia bacterium]